MAQYAAFTLPKTFKVGFCDAIMRIAIVTGLVAAGASGQLTPIATILLAFHTLNQFDSKMESATRAFVSQVLQPMLKHPK